MICLSSYPRPTRFWLGMALCLASVAWAGALAATTFPSESEESITVHAAQWPKEVRDFRRMSVENGTLLIRGEMDNHVLRADVSNPADMRILEPLSLGYAGSFPGAIQDGHRRYVGHQVFDTSDASSPRQIGSVLDFRGYFMVESNVLYRADGPKLQILNMENLVHPVVLGETTFAGVSYWAEGRMVGPVAAGEIYLLGYTSTSRPLIVKVNAKDPRKPVEFGRYSGTTELMDFAVTASHIYVAANSGGLHVVDASKPGTFTRVKTVPGSAVSRVLAGDNSLLLVRNDSTGLDVYDAADPTNLVKRSSIPGRRTRLQSKVMNEALAGRTLFAYEEGSIAAYDLANTSEPKLLGKLQIGESMFIMALRFAGQYALMGESSYFEWSGSQPGLVVLDMSNPLKPSRVATLVTQGGVNNLEIVGNIAYVHGKSGVVHTVDITDIRQPVMRSTIAMNAMFYDRIIPTGKRLYATLSGMGELRIYDMSDIARPVLKGTVRNLEMLGGDERPELRFVASEKLLVARAPFVQPAPPCKVIDVSNPASPSEKATVNGHPLGLRHDILYMVEGRKLKVYDLAQPANPRLIAEIDRRETAYRGAGQFRGDLLVTDKEIFDLTNPAAPRLTGAIVNLPGDPQHLKDYTLNGEYLYSCHGFEGLKVSKFVSGASFADDLAVVQTNRWLQTPKRPGAQGIVMAEPGVARISGEDRGAGVGVARVGPNFSDVAVQAEITNWQMHGRNDAVIGLRARWGFDAESKQSWYEAQIRPGGGDVLPQFAIGKMVKGAWKVIASQQFPIGRLSPLKRYLLQFEAHGSELKAFLLEISTTSGPPLTANLIATDADLVEGCVGLCLANFEAPTSAVDLDRFQASGVTLSPRLGIEKEQVWWGAWNADFKLESSRTLTGSFQPLAPEIIQSADGLRNLVANPLAAEPGPTLFLRLRK